MKVAIAQVTVGERRRQDMGDIAALAASIGRYGLLHPIVVDGEGHLVAGHRRLQACVHLGWSDIDVRPLGELSDVERREIELEENLRRKDLTDYERSRDMTELAAVAASALVGEFSTESVEKPGRGRPRKPDSNDHVAERIGVPRTTLQEAQTHVETADAYPFMQRWKQSEVLAAHEALAKLPPQERPAVVALVGQPGIPARNAIEIADNLARKTEPERTRIYTLAESADSRDRSRALTDAAAKPPMPDPRLSLLEDVERTLRKAIRLFPGDPANEALTRFLECLAPVYQAVKESHRG